MRSRKRFGQNFLVDAIDPKPGDRIVEIGPGHGELTGELAKSGCRLDVIEIDRDLIADLRCRYPALNVIEADVLKYDFSGLAKEVRARGKSLRIVGNLPYNISTPLLFKLFGHLADIRDMHFMLQLEVVERMTAGPSSGNYGRLSVMTRYYCETEKLFSVPATAFRPKPRVTSAIIRLRPRQSGERADDVAVLEAMVTEAFSRRRKTIRNALKSFLSEAEIASLSLDSNLRPENLSLSDYVTCANYVSRRPA
jgi:16S rRNA (adenine1518-N6/adenine1519-N6)-dimethyltransferase